jgi:hypothetical protein
MSFDPAQLLQQIEGEQLDPRDMTGLRFQDVVFARMNTLLERMVEKCGLPKSFALSNHETGEVDFVLRHVDPNTGTEIARHLFECKNYRRTLELSVAAKFLLIGLRRLPASLNLVSATALQRQATEYARFFFLQDADSRPTEEKPGGSTIFRHWVTRDLVEFEDDFLLAHDAQPAAGAISWEFALLDAFFERVVASSKSPSPTIDVRPDRFYRIDATIEADRRLELHSFGFLAGLPGLVRMHGEPVIEVDPSHRVIRFSALLQVDRAAAGAKIALPVLGIAGDDGSPECLLPKLNVANETALSVDMRPNDTATFQRLFAGTDDWRLILFTGEAGTGKTWICKRFAEERRAFAGWDVLQFDVPKNAGLDLLREMAVKLMLPPRLRTDDQQSDLEQLATEVMRILAPVPGDGDDTPRDRSPVILSEFVAQAVVQLGPRLIVVRNCEQLSDAAARDIAQLVRAIELRGWGEVRVILEGRDDEKSAVAWRNLCQDLGAMNDVVRFHLKQMEREQVEDWLDERFEAIVPELKEICFDRAGGYPLLLQSLCDWLAAEGAIERRGDRWRIIASPTEFRRRLTARNIRYSTQQRSNEILVGRLRSIEFGDVAAQAPAHLRDPHLLLGLFALAETPDRMAVLAEMLGVGDIIVRLSAVLESEGLRDSAASAGELRFRHDRYREAAVELVRDVADNVLGELLRLLPAGNELERTAVELLGDIQALAGQHNRSWAQYQRAIESAAAADAFIDICRIASKQEELFDSDPSKRWRPYDDYLRSLTARAWAEWNCGSMRTSRDTYERVIQKAMKASDVFIKSTVARAFIAHASWRLVGINLELIDSGAFVDSAVKALEDGQNAGDYNAVMNRLVLYCGRFGLPDLGVSFVPLSLAQMPVSSEEVAPESREDGAVICADVGRLYLDTMPDLALDIFRTGQQRSTGRRQQLWATIDVLIADYLVKDELNLDSAALLRDDAVRMGLFAFLVRLDLLRSADALRKREIREAERLLDQARERIAVHEQPSYEVALANNALLSALLSEDGELAISRARELVRCVELGLDGREKAFPRLSGPIRELVVARWKRYEPSPLSVNISNVSAPPLCSSLLRAWFNLRALEKCGNSDLAALAGSVAKRSPSALDVPMAEAAFGLEAERRGVEWDGICFALCIE